MKTIGLLGGMSWESTVTYYQTINRVVNAQVGGLHSAKIILSSVDFHEVNRVEGLLEGEAQRLESAGADFLVLCTNTMHRLAEEIQEGISIPMLHIADATGKEINRSGTKWVGLLGTKTTMEQDFYRGRLEERWGVSTIVPPEADREIVHRIIFEELCHGRIRKSSRSEYCRIISDFAEQGIESVILGCTEIGLLVRPPDTSANLFDTAQIHAVAAAHYALE
jgi:aspartate racemase